jgi:hypothetical protein
MKAVKMLLVSSFVTVLCGCVEESVGQEKGASPLKLEYEIRDAEEIYGDHLQICGPIAKVEGSNFGIVDLCNESGNGLKSVLVLPMVDLPLGLEVNVYAVNTKNPGLGIGEFYVINLYHFNPFLSGE